MAVGADFVHLHVHSDFSIGYSTVQFESLQQICGLMKMKAIALTDHGVLSGVVEFTTKIRSWGIRPILGCGFFFQSEQETAGPAHAVAAHVTLLAINDTGYRNLCALSSAVCREGIPSRSQVDFEMLSRHADGLIAFSEDLATAERLFDLFGRDRFRLELPSRWLSDPMSPVRDAVSLAHRLDVPLLATHEVRCLENMWPPMSSPGDFTRCLPDFIEFFRGFPEAVRETVEIAKRCDFVLDLQTRHIPHFRVNRPSEDEGGGGANAILRRLCEEGVRRLFGSPVPLPARERLELEIAAIANHGVADLFLLHWDLVRFARENGILLGPGRGLAPSSLVNYCLGITEVDPLRYGLIFERFMRPSGVSEFFIDCARSGRERLIKYLRERWAPGKVVRAASFRRLSSKAAVRAVASAQKPYWDKAEPVLNTIEPGWSNWGGQALPKISRIISAYESDEIRTEDSNEIRKARELEGTVVGASADTARLALMESHLAGAVPTWGEADPVAQLEEGDLSQMGLPVLWLLGLEGLDRLDAVLRFVEAAEGYRIDLERIPLDDSAVYDLLSRGETWGIFDWDKDSVRDLLVKLRPQRFSDLVALAALDQLGPRNAGILDDYVARRSAGNEGSRILPGVARILAESRGLLLYPEQAIHIAGEVAGMSRREGEKWRKEYAVRSNSPFIEKEFIAGSEKRGVPEQKAREVLAVMERHGPYTSSKSHSVAWALLSYRMAWLKTHHPEEFRVATMRHEGEWWW